MTDATQKTAEEVLAEIVEIFKEYYNSGTYHVAYRKDENSAWHQCGGFDKAFMTIEQAVKVLKEYEESMKKFSRSGEYALQKNDILLPNLQCEYCDDAPEQIAKILHAAGYLK